MYNERKETFSFRSFFLTLLLLVLFILLMLFLFPTRWEFKKSCNGSTGVVNDKTVKDEIFTNNLNKMKDAARGYYTSEKLPKNINETKKMTLKEMYDKHLVLRVKDKDGKECNKEKSYTEVTKTSDGYKLKVNLSCGKQEDYIIVNLSDYNICSNNCDKKTDNTKTNTTTTQTTQKDNVVKTNTTINTTTKTTTNTNTQTVVVNPQPTKVSVTGVTVSQSSVTLKVGESIKITATVQPSNATNKNLSWSNSDPKIVKMSNGTITGLAKGKSIITVKTIDGGKVATVVVTVIDSNKQQTKPAETNPEQKPTETVTYKCKYVNGKYYDSTGKVVTLDAYNKSCKTLYYEYKLTTTTKSYSSWSDWSKTSIKATSTLEVDTKTVEEKVSKKQTKDVIVGYESVPATVTASTRTGKSAQMPQNKTTDCCEVKYENIVKLDNGLYSWKEVTYKIVYTAKPIIKQVEETVYETKNVTYYRSRKVTSTTKTDTKWSTNKNDTALINKGYKATGVKEYR